MAIDPKKLQEVQDALKEIEKIYKTIGQTNPLGGFKLNTIKDIDQTLQDVNDELDKAQIKLTNWEDSVSGIYNSFKSIVSEISKSATGINASKKALTASSKVAAELRDYHMGISKLSVKEIQNQKEKLLTSQQNLKSAQNILQEEEARLINGKTIFDLSNKERSQLLEIRKALKANNRALQDKDKLYAQTLADLEAAEETETKINKQLGLTGGLLKGISKIPILGDVFDANEAVGEMDKHLRAGGSSAGALGKGVKNVGKQLKSGVLNSSNLIVGAITLLISAFKKVDGIIEDMARGLNLTYTQARQVKQEMSVIADTSDNIYLNSIDLSKSLLTINQRFGTTAQISSENLKSFTELREQAGMTNEEILGIYGYSKLTGKSVKDSVNSFQATAKAASFQAGAALNTKVLMADIANTSKRLQISISGGEKGLAKAAVNAKLLGINLNDASAIAEQLLNFESSIENELQAELLLGKNINLEKARQAALNNDIATLTAEIAREAGTAEEFGNMNRIQQEAIAKAVGMSADSLGDALYEQEALASLGKQLNDEEQKAFNLAKERYGVEKATQMIKDGQFDQLKQQMGMQTRFNKVVEKLQDIFVVVAESMMPIFEGLASLVEALSPVFKILNLVARVLDVIFSTIIDIAKIFTGDFSFSGFQRSVGGLMDVGSSLLSGDDIMSPGGSSSGYGSRTLFGPEGAIQLNNKDTVIAGTNLFGNDVKSEPGKPTQMAGAGEMKAGGASVDMTQTNALLQQLISAVTTGGVVTLDGQKVGEALKIGSFQTQ